MKPEEKEYLPEEEGLRPHHVAHSEERETANLLMFAAGVFTACTGSAVIIIGALAIASLICIISPPAGVALLVGGGIALAAGMALTFWGAQNKKPPPTEPHPQYDEKENINSFGAEMKSA